ncbi:2-succinyl-5-enolpyruvyl-6-hydroxy-3-cyclohexene-1-carboxylic-acid synthase [Corynebacterium sp. H78]|uniref:2-succinyl-5-enolpyruvyl-6-hydroxy-3- cyclohexene-1-carboxylic-acid synthase n=2 Tax=Corynebacterium sp. H78 TaxID=3133417 RepID=UPI003095A19A
MDSVKSPAAVTAGVIVDELIRCGMREAVVCPGSRSAPLSRALLAASNAGRIRLHVRIDERSAAFLALGLAAQTRRITPIVTTSGTAVANLTPAMVEATYSNIPLLALTADRPSSYQGTGANQTIDQAQLFAKASVAEFDLDGTAEVTQSSAAVIRARIDRLVATATASAGYNGAHNSGRVRDTRGGAVHLNVRFVEPLVPQVDEEPTIPEGRPYGAPWTDISHLRQVVAGHESVAKLDLSRRTLVIAGSGAVAHPALYDVPTIAEPSTFAPEFPVHPLAAGAFAQILPEHIVVLGRPTLHRGVAKLLANPDIDVTVVASDTDYPDVTANARRVVRGVETTGECAEQWLKVCEAASELGVKAVRETLQETTDELTGLHVAAAMTDSLRTGDLLVLGASNSVRDASWAGLPFPGVDVYAGRGAAGIDGTVATAIGIALARDRANSEEIRPPRTLALMGDLTFLHDAGALSIGPDEPRPANLTIVVANDTGGGIFETLEAGAPDLRSGFERIFGTAQDVDLGALCEAYGAQYVLVRELPDLLQQLHPDTDVDGIRVIEAVTARGSRRDVHEKLYAKAELR